MKLKNFDLIENADGAVEGQVDVTTFGVINIKTERRGIYKGREGWWKFIDDDTFLPYFQIGKLERKWREKNG